MWKKMAVLAAAFLMIGIYAYAGNGDLVVNGNLGVGTANPTSYLAGTSGLSIYNNSYPAAGLANANNYWLWYMAGNDLRIWEPSGERVAIQKGGNVGIGTTTPGFKLQVMGTVASYSTVLTSDINKKENLLPINDALNKVLRLGGVSYEWKEDFYKTKETPDGPEVQKKRELPEGRHYGVIAQEIEKVLPEVVKVGSDGTKAVAYMEIIPVLIEAIKEQQTQIEQLKKQMANMQK